MSRGFVAIFHLDFAKALRCNALSIPLFFGIVLYCGVFAIDLIFDKNNLEKVEAFMVKKYMFAIYVLILIVATVLNNVF